MLLITHPAVEALKRLVESRKSSAGQALRIVERPGNDGRAVLMLALSNPRESDLAVTDRGLKVFLEPQVASRLEGKLLDARYEDERVRFTVSPQSPAAG